MNLIEKQFTEQRYNFAYCVHKHVISDILEDNQFYSTDGETEAVPNYRLKIDS